MGLSAKNGGTDVALEEDQKMKVLITGGAGFIGSHLAERLLEQGNEVSIIDNLWTGKLANIAEIQTHERLHLVVDTILNESVMNELIFKADHIYHFAAAVGVRNIMDHPVETLDINVKGTEVEGLFQQTNCHLYQQILMI